MLGHRLQDKLGAVRHDGGRACGEGAEEDTRELLMVDVNKGIKFSKFFPTCDECVKWVYELFNFPSAAGLLTRPVVTEMWRLIEDNAVQYMLQGEDNPANTVVPWKEHYKNCEIQIWFNFYLYLKSICMHRITARCSDIYTAYSKSSGRMQDSLSTIFIHK